MSAPPGGYGLFAEPDTQLGSGGSEMFNKILKQATLLQTSTFVFWAVLCCFRKAQYKKMTIWIWYYSIALILQRWSWVTGLMLVLTPRLSENVQKNCAVVHMYCYTLWCKEPLSELNRILRSFERFPNSFLIPVLGHSHTFWRIGFAASASFSIGKHEC